VTDARDDAEALAAERAAARAGRDFARADALRDRIAELGFRVVDGPGGSTLEPLGQQATARRRPHDVASVLEEPAAAEATVHLLVEGWPEDAVRALAGYRAHEAGLRVQYVVTDLTDSDPSSYGAGVEVLSLEPGSGWGAARNAGLRRSRGRIVVVADGSIEPTGDVLGPLARALEDPAMGVCGPFGISSDDLREFHESDGAGPNREVDAIEGYLMALRRDVVRDAGLFDERFRWYRTADIELSFRVRDAGYRASVVDVPVAKHEHRMWHATPPAERDRLSKRNHYRFLERFRGREDLLVGRGRSERG
jgi:GT2 family glycosyltransferase